MLEYTKPTLIHLKSHPTFTEKWVQDHIAEDPTLLGLGEMELRDVERPQPKAGRLDLLLRDPESGKRYEVELMLGVVDESHIIRTIEYWDIERKRYPQYDHCAVIVAEDITSRFLNVIGLFNSAIPIIALQMSAYQVDESVILTFAKVLDEIVLGADEEDEVDAVVTDRAYWETRASKKSLAIVDECISILKEIVPGLELTYKKQYMGLTEDGRTNNFIVFEGKKQFIRVRTAIREQDHWKERLEDAGISVMGSGKKSRRLDMNLSKEHVKTHRDLLKEFFSAACAEQQG